jgi:cellulose synthase/poly-beta-1,6-N-acetylglucosamine synthase-like glycosyltransferase
MNLNSYIGLMGNKYQMTETEAGKILTPTETAKKDILEIPDSDFVLTLDADSILLREYCLRLVYFMNQTENKQVAVAQTPYSSFRGALTRIERLAGATTDVQHILHQGMSWYGAAFWVGANAVIRKNALEDIAETYSERGFEMKRYIQDRTVIEDTESSVDIVAHGWKIVNYPERLSYSATPPDFGSLIVQRRRWANGGLLIMPKLFRTNETKHKTTKIEFFLRMNYMASIAWATLGLIFLLAYPYDGRLLSPLVLLSAIPYFIAMASDLKYNGYKYSDIFHIYGFNLIMLPVNLAGVLKSLEQILTDKKIPFARTPKVKDRTQASVQYTLIPVMIVAFSIFTVYRNVVAQNWGNAIFAGFNSALASWAILSYIGISNLLTDTWHGLTDWLYVEDTENKVKILDNEVKTNHWKSVIYHGASGHEE